MLLLNDKFDPGWQVTVDGKPTSVLRCNYIMRGVQLEKGEHTVEFRFESRPRGFEISVAADILALAMIALIAAQWKRNGQQE